MYGLALLVDNLNLRVFKGYCKKNNNKEIAFHTSV